MAFPKFTSDRLVRYHPSFNAAFPTAAQSTAPAAGTQPASPARSSRFSFPGLFATHQGQNADEVWVKRLFLHAALVHTGMGIITVLLSVMLGTTVTEALLAVWQLFCGIIGFSALCLERPSTTSSDRPVFPTSTWLRLYSSMTSIAVLISLGACIHGIVILSAVSQLAIPRLADYVDADHMAIWYVILGVSNLVAGVGGATGNGVLLRKMFTAWKRLQIAGLRTSAGQNVQVVGGPPRYTATAPDAELSSSGADLMGMPGNSPPPAYAASPDHVVVMTSEPPPSYEAALNTPAVFIISATSGQTGVK